jgi:hypothetical protein
MANKKTYTEPRIPVTGDAKKQYTKNFNAIVWKSLDNWTMPKGYKKP